MEKEYNNINPAKFLIFAEYMGFQSNLTDVIEDWNNGIKPKDYQIRLIQLEAKDTLVKMKKEYDQKMIKQWYETYKTIVLDNLNELKL